MHRAFSFPMTVERSRNKERLEASLAGLCELELRKQRQECLVLGALALGDPVPENLSRNELLGFSSWGQENLTLRRQLSALQSSPWGLMRALEQQVSELRVDEDEGSVEETHGDTGDSRPSSGFYESGEDQSPRWRPSSTEPTEAAWTHNCSERPLPLGDPLLLNVDVHPEQTLRAPLPRSLSVPYPPLEGIAEEGPPEEHWQWEQHADWRRRSLENEEEDYQQALRVESNILGLIRRRTLTPGNGVHRASLAPEPPHAGVSRQSNVRGQTPSLHHPKHPRLCDPDPGDLSPNPQQQAWAGSLLEGEAYDGGEAPSEEEEEEKEAECYLALPHPQSRPHPLAGGLFPPMEPHGGAAPERRCQSLSIQHHTQPSPPPSRHQNWVSAHFLLGQVCHAATLSPIHHGAEASPKTTSLDQPGTTARSTLKNREDHVSHRQPSHRTSRSESDSSLLGHGGLPERRYSTSERPHGPKGQAQRYARATGLQPGASGGRRWCSTQELSQEEGESHQANRRPPPRLRYGQACLHAQSQGHHHHHAPPHHAEYPETAPLCRAEEGYARGAPGESESSMSEVYSPASSSLSSDSDESGGLVWPQQLPPRLAQSSSSSSSSPQASSDASARQSKAFVKIKASHALKKKILRFRSGSLKVMTTV